jgi:hypothetical protein
MVDNTSETDIGTSIIGSTVFVMVSLILIDVKFLYRRGRNDPPDPFTQTLDFTTCLEVYMAGRERSEVHEARL